MPVYEYQCKSCGVRFERTQSFKDEPIKVCPECHGETYRVIGATGVIFKGSGFYINDSKSKNTSVTPAKTESKSEGKTEASAETKTESKPEAKGDAAVAAATPVSTPAPSTSTSSSTSDK